jgi:endoglucanase
MKKTSLCNIFICAIHFISCAAIAQADGGTAFAAPDSALLSLQRPEPAIVRGFTFRERMDQKDYDDARSWGANVIRIHIFPARYAAQSNKDFWDALPAYLDGLEIQIKQAKKAGMKVVIDLHQPPFLHVKSFDHAEFWDRSDLEVPFCRVWTEIARRFLPYKDVIWGYDLLNEPLDRSQLPRVAKQWRPLAIKIVEAIRKVDRDTWIIFEPGPGSLFNGFDGLEPLPDPKIIYSAHFYYPQDFTHQGVSNIEGTDLAKAMEKINLQYPSTENGSGWNKERFAKILSSADAFQARWKVPIYVGEFSVIRWAPKASAVRWLRDVVGLFEERGWSWSYHAFREFNGWSLEHDEQFWTRDMEQPQRALAETERGSVIRSAMRKNNQ